MLKKIITLGLVVLLMLAFTVPAFAQDGEEVGGDPTEETGEDTTIPENPHPIVLAIAQRYNVTYGEVAAMFNGTMDDYQDGTARATMRTRATTGTMKTRATTGTTGTTIRTNNPAQNR